MGSIQIGIHLKKLNLNSTQVSKIMTHQNKVGLDHPIKFHPFPYIYTIISILHVYIHI